MASLATNPSRDITVNIPIGAEKCYKEQEVEVLIKDYYHKSNVINFDPNLKECDVSKV